MKRTKFLERNRLVAFSLVSSPLKEFVLQPDLGHSYTHCRAAASRCRAKKKQWVESLEKKAKELEVVNQALQQEVLMLRSEVQQLKSILIAHKDCPLIVNRTSKTGGCALIRLVCVVCSI